MESQARVGAVLDGRYRLDRLIGQGGMGTVYRAYHLAMERDVAVKVLRASLSDDPLATKRFLLEAKATTRVESPHAVKVFDFGVTTEGEYFMVMEYLDGRTAQHELDIDGPFSVDRALAVARHALAALGAAHAVGVVHRDIKPENLLLLRVGDDPDFCKVLDFGVAKLLAGAELAGTALTKDGMVFGTPDYMSPEQACGQPLDGRSDVYSLAATLFALITGRPLFRGDAAIRILSQHVTSAPPHLTDLPGLSHLHALDQVLQRALAKDPRDRQRDADELARELSFLESTAARLAPSQAAPTMPVRALTRGRTPESPLGVLTPGTSAAPAALPTGAAPLIAIPGPSSAHTGYSPAVSPMAARGHDSTQALVAAVMPRRRLRWAALTAALVVGAAGGALAVSRLASPRSEPAPKIAIVSPDAAAPVPVTPPRPAPARPVHDAGPASADAGPASADAGLPADGAADGDAPDKGEDDDRKTRARKHVAAAAAAQRAGNVIRQLTEAEFALRLAPRDPKALLLAGDALLRSGDLAKGCRYLARVKTAAGQARAQEAGCR